MEAAGWLLLIPGDLGNKFMDSPAPVQPGAACGDSSLQQSPGSDGVGRIKPRPGHSL